MSTISHHEAERPAMYDARQRRLAQLWFSGAISDCTYLRSRFIDGKLPDEANTEMALMRMEKLERRRG